MTEDLKREEARFPEYKLDFKEFEELVSFLFSRLFLRLFYELEEWEVVVDFLLLVYFFLGVVEEMSELESEPLRSSEEA